MQSFQIGNYGQSASDPEPLIQALQSYNDLQEEENITVQEFESLKKDVQTTIQAVQGAHSLINNLLTPLCKLVEQQQRQQQLNVLSYTDTAHQNDSQGQTSTLLLKLMPKIQDRVGQYLGDVQQKFLGTTLDLVKSMDVKYEALSKQIQNLSQQPQRQHHDLIEQVRKVKKRRCHQYCASSSQGSTSSTLEISVF
eukprot:TRINITY_DN3815_c0_g1_i3.p5 TRINITY_DN3815_c0_g1~~TRINITY_DN3815_c0_g1_i3.p5  ORF type:complete len:195 (-),score=11.06 TRINITY_DN3815_c0_g1_i3:2117-2701(-)